MNRMNRRSYVAVAAVFALAAFPTFYSESGSTAFAQLREQLDKVRTITFDVKLEVDGKPPEMQRQMIRDDGRIREEYSDGRYSVVKRTKDAFTRIDVDPAKETVRIMYGFSQADLAKLLNPIHMIRNLPKSAGARPIDARQIGGRPCSGFVIDLKLGKHGTQQMRLWTDPETRLLVYYEVVAERKLPKGTRPDGAKVSTRAVATCSNFKYNVALEDSLFALTPPEGYTVASVGTPPKQHSERWPAEKLVLTVGEGIGPAKFGMSKEEVLEVLGEPEEKKKLSPQVREGFPVSEKEMWRYNSQGFSITFSSLPEPGLHVVICRRGNFVSRDFKGKTKEGIGLGSSPEEVRRAFGEPQDEQPIKDGLGAFRYHDKRLMVGFADGGAAHLQIERIPKKKPSSDEQDK